jgi:hypothetical protein
MTWLTLVLMLIVVFATFGFGAPSIVKQPANAWSDETVPAAIDPAIAHLVEIMNKPAPWDHNWYALEELFQQT